MKGMFNRLRSWGATRLLKYTMGVLHRQPVELITLPVGKRWLIIAPHNDDESIATGGLLAKLQDKKETVEVVFVTGNPQASAETVANRRWTEAEKVSRYLGFTAEGWGLPDRFVAFSEKEFEDRMRKKLAAYDPDIILCPFPTDHHRDHQSCSMLLGEVINHLPFKGEIWCYEVWSTLWPNIVLDISEVIERKQTAIRFYRSQLEALPYDSAVLGLNRYRGLKHRIEYGEAFYRCNKRDFCELTMGLLRL